MKRCDRTLRLLVVAMGGGVGILASGVTAVKAAGGETSTITSFLQNTTKQEDVKGDNTQAKQLSMKVVGMSGRVSNDGKTFISDKGNRTWAGSNPDALKGHEGYQVKVKGYLDTTNNEINVISVKVRPAYSVYRNSHKLCWRAREGERKGEPEAKAAVAELPSRVEFRCSTRTHYFSSMSPFRR